jgi:LmbE family N-acetylglucosaminyl deacetylase
MQLDYHRALREIRASSATTSCLPERGPVLVLAPHSDDEILGAGGTAALHVRRGDRVDAAIATDGRFGQGGEIDPRELVRIREAESRAAGECIGFTRMYFGGMGDRHEASRRKMVQWLSGILRELRPRVIYLPSPIDFHPDHAMVNEFLYQALRTSVADPEWVAGYEVWATLWPNHVIDITSTVEIKRRALDCFPSQMGRSNVDGACLGLGRYRGLTSGVGSTAEAFSLSSAADFLRLWERVHW